MAVNSSRRYGIAESQEPVLWNSPSSSPRHVVGPTGRTERAAIAGFPLNLIGLKKVFAREHQRGRTARKPW